MGDGKSTPHPEQAGGCEADPGLSPPEPRLWAAKRPPLASILILPCARPNRHTPRMATPYSINRSLLVMATLLVLLGIRTPAHSKTNDMSTDSQLSECDASGPLRRARGKLQFYDVRHLLFGISVFDRPMEYIERQRRLPLDKRALVLPDDPDLILTEDYLVEVIKLNCGRGTWNHYGQDAIRLTHGVLIVSQSRDTHIEIKKFFIMLKYHR